MISGRFGDNKFTVKTYRGPNAMKEWRRDFLRISKDWCGVVPLFGYSKSSVPLLIFHGELVPLAHLEYRSGPVGLFYMEVLRASWGCSRNELWMDPIAGRFCRGPSGPQCIDWNTEYLDMPVPADGEFLKEDVVIRYFSSIGHTWGLLKALVYSGYTERPKDVPAANCSHVVLTNSIVALTEGVRWRSFKGCLEHRQEMPDGVTRFCLRDNQRHIQVITTGQETEWLLQAVSVFNAQGISLDEDLSSYKFIHRPFILTGTLQQSKRKQQRRQLSAPIYLFLSANVYFWSHDSSGQTPFSPDICRYLGLPFKLSLQVDHYQLSWPTKVYKAIHDHQISEGFDPTTTDYARCFGLPIFKIVPAENRFQEVVEEQNENISESEQTSPPLQTHDQEDGRVILGSKEGCDIPAEDHPKELGDTFSLEMLFNEIQTEESTMEML
ncbi:hypothetical protein E1B28_003422 [Marasmius oreades]|uniref:Uncharacterized protein n=1 Tax=Marasmius oreades TaxID=181124 RepID=A0A9P7RN07_9AGAR|nr:uncharacterized protein E1B28_003422 [Marasmius oreades]KAG7085888.1 hypothetical protein E1B28_003422 [Marasmius oreades]